MRIPCKKTGIIYGCDCAECEKIEEIHKKCKEYSKKCLKEHLEKIKEEKQS